MAHPYIELENTPVWRAIEAAIVDLEENSDLSLTTAREYVVGYIAQAVSSVSLGMREFVVEESFDLSPRGVVVLIRGNPEDLPLGSRIPVSIRRPDGRLLESEASVESVLRRREIPDGHCSLLIYQLTKAEVPPESVVLVPPR